MNDLSDPHSQHSATHSRELKLGPRYRMVEQIAAGGMGTVVLALRQDAGGNNPMPVAIKKLHAHLIDNPDVVTSFVDEARIASRILHPNVVHVHDVEMINDELMIVMDFVDGIPLRDLLRGNAADKGLPIPCVRRIMVDALLGLHAAHELASEDGAPLGVVHRDVSPHNLLVGTNGVTSVTDFGIAMAAGRIASTKADGAVKGKLQYLSPEQVFRKGVDRRADVFAAGVVLWEALVGRKLFDAGTEGETLAMILREPIQPPSAHRLDVPLDLDETCLRALERETDRRFSTAEELAIALEDGGIMATREEVAELVMLEAGERLAKRHHVLEQAMIHGSLPPPSIPIPLLPMSSVRNPQMMGMQMPMPMHAHSSSVAVPIVRTRGGIPPIALMIVASLCVSGGLLIGFNVRGGPPTTPQQQEAVFPPPPPIPASIAIPAAATTTPTMSAVVPAATTTIPAPIQTSANASPSSQTKVVPRVHRAPTPAGAGAKTSAPASSVRTSPTRPFMPDDL